MIGLGLYKFGCQSVPVSSRPLYNVQCEKKKDKMSFHNNFKIGSPSELHNLQCTCTCCTGQYRTIEANTGQMYTEPDNG